jgi:hypothetical protein
MLKWGRMFVYFFMRFILLFNLFYFSSYGSDIKWTNYSLRALGMGNAVVSSPYREEALFYNPAGLAKNRGLHLSLINLDFIASKNIINELWSFFNSADFLSYVNKFKLKNNIGHQIYAEINYTPYLIIGNFGIGLNANLNPYAVIHAHPSLNLDAHLEFTVPVGIAGNFFENKLSVGIVTKLISKISVKEEISIESLKNLGKLESFNKDKDSEMSAYHIVDIYARNIHSGIGLGWDIGILLSPTDKMEPSFGLSVNDIASNYILFKILDKIEKIPENRPTTVNAGFSFKPYKKNNSHIILSLDIHAINLDYSYSKKINYGMEYAFNNFLKFQIGSYQGALTLGMNLNIPGMNLSMVTYKSQLGRYSGQNELLESRRIALSFNMGF